VLFPFILRLGRIKSRSLGTATPRQLPAFAFKEFDWLRQRTLSNQIEQKQDFTLARRA
jgi:hypothetical protein